MKQTRMVRVLPRRDGKCAAMVPLGALKVGMRLRLPVVIGDAHETPRLTAACTVTEIHWDKHWLRCAYKAGKAILHECYQFLTEED